ILHKKRPTEYEAMELILTRFVIFGGLNEILDEEDSVLVRIIQELFSDLLSEDWREKIKNRLTEVDKDIYQKYKIPENIWCKLTPSEKEEEHTAQLLLKLDDLAAA